MSEKTIIDEPTEPLTVVSVAGQQFVRIDSGSHPLYPQWYKVGSGNTPYVWSTLLSFGTVTLWQQPCDCSAALQPQIAALRQEVGQIEGNALEYFHRLNTANAHIAKLENDILAWEDHEGFYATKYRRKAKKYKRLAKARKVLIDEAAKAAWWMGYEKSHPAVILPPDSAEPPVGSIVAMPGKAAWTHSAPGIWTTYGDSPRPWSDMMTLNSVVLLRNGECNE